MSVVVRGPHGARRASVAAPQEPNAPNRTANARCIREASPGELPGEILRVVQELLPVQDERVAGLSGRRIHRVVEHRRLAELIAGQNALSAASGRLTLIEIRVEVRANGYEEVDARPTAPRARGNQKPGRSSARGSVHSTYTSTAGPRGRHQVVGRREGEQVDDENQIVVAPGARRLVCPRTTSHSTNAIVNTLGV